MTDSEKLKLILILCSICIEQDVSKLKNFIKVSARYIDNNDFNKILRKTIKITENKRCGTMSCPDWLMNELFQLYKSDSLS
jgi:hypothetical protein